jgi:flagellar M-ring protein FliF
LRFIVGIVVLMMIYSRVLKPMLAKLSSPPKPQMSAQSAAVEDEGSVVSLSGGQVAARQPAAYEQTLDAAKQLAKDNPRMVASVVSGWTSGEEA